MWNSAAAKMLTIRAGLLKFLIALSWPAAINTSVTLRDPSMKTSRIVAIVFLLISLSFLLTAVGSTAPKPVSSPESFINSYHGVLEEIATGPIDESGGIKEEVPTKYAARYQDWKREFLSTEAGRNQWASYEHNPNFTLTIAVSRENAEGATTGRYKWNDSGQLIAATI